MKQIVLQQTESTNDDALFMIRQSNNPKKMVIFTKQQTKGRGTRGRVWDTPKSAILGTLIYPLHRPISHYVGVTLSIAIAIATVLRKYKADVYVKWPNDLVYKEKKLAGILVEQARSQDGKLAFAIGFGINITLSKIADDRVGLSELIGELSERNIETIREECTAAIDACLQEFEMKGIQPTIARWEGYGAYLNQPVDVYQDGQKVVHGLLLGIDARGSLIVKNNQGTFHFFSATLRLGINNDSTR